MHPATNAWQHACAGSKSRYCKHPDMTLIMSQGIGAVRCSVRVRRRRLDKMPFIVAPSTPLGTPTRPTPRKRPRPRQYQQCTRPCSARLADGAGSAATPASIFQDYADWSADFLALCQSQLDLLGDSIPGITQAAILFRREHPSSGALEFVPLVVLTNPSEPPSTERVWISPGSASQLELGPRKRPLNLELPGGIPAARLLPDYPFVSPDAGGGIVMPDGGLCVPVEYNDVFAGSVVLWREAAPTAWEGEEVARVRHVARSIALGAALEGKVASAQQSERSMNVLVESIRSLLQSSMHQIRSPIAALVTFGHLLLRKLPPGDSMRALAKNIVVESLRLDDLLEPLDRAQKQLVIGAGTKPAFENDSSKAMLRTAPASDDKAADKDAYDEDGEDSEPNLRPNPYPYDIDPNPEPDAELVWISDIVEPIANSAAYLAQEKGLVLHRNIDDDTPPVFVVERSIREAIYNLVDNAMRYTPVGGFVGIASGTTENEKGETIVEVLVWDTGTGVGNDERWAVWEQGFRGRAAIASGVAGSGMGLDISRAAIISAGGTIEALSPVPSHLDPRDEDDAKHDQPGTVFCIRFPRAM